MSLSTLSQILTSENEHPDGFYFCATIETGIPGLARLNVACCQAEDDKVESSQGMDLTAAECKALAQMLLGVAAILDANSNAS